MPLIYLSSLIMLYQGIGTSFCFCDEKSFLDDGHHNAECMTKCKERGSETFEFWGKAKKHEDTCQKL